MKKWIDKFIKILHQNKGETLMEIIVSLFVLSILLLVVTTMIQTALRMTSALTQSAKETQESVMNPVMWSDYTDIANYSDSNVVHITFSYEINGETKIARHEVEFNVVDGVIAFSPRKNSDASEVE